MFMSPATLIVFVPVIATPDKSASASPFRLFTVKLPAPSNILPAKLAAAVTRLVPLLTVTLSVVVIPLLLIVIVLSPSNVNGVAGKLPVNVTSDVVLTVVVPLVVIPTNTADATELLN